MATNKTICLTMIVKNESKIIRRCLEATLPLIDRFSICDTGSTDNTVEIIEQFGKDYKIPGVVHHDKWLNFGHNRTLSIKNARKYLEAEGLDVTRCHLLLVDADMVLKVYATKEHIKSLLTVDGSHIDQYTPDIRYRNQRIICLSRDWICRGVTHEFYETADAKTKGHGNSNYLEPKIIEIDDRNDGGSKADKFERDIRLLTQALQTETDEGLKTRYMYYLAQSYRDSGELETAIKWFARRAEAGYYMEEAYYAKLQEGVCYDRLYRRALEYEKKKNKYIEDHKSDKDKLKEALGEKKTGKIDDGLDDEERVDVLKKNEYWQRTVDCYIRAWQMRSSRAESLHHLVSLYQDAYMHREACLWSVLGSKIIYPKEDGLFLAPHVYEYQFLRHLSICGNYLAEYKKIGMRSCEKLRLLACVPNHEKVLALRNQQYYLPPEQWEIRELSPGGAEEKNADKTYTLDSSVWKQEGGKWLRDNKEISFGTLKSAHTEVMRPLTGNLFLIDLYPLVVAEVQESRLVLKYLSRPAVDLAYTSAISTNILPFTLANAPGYITISAETLTMEENGKTNIIIFFRWLWLNAKFELCRMSECKRCTQRITGLAAQQTPGIVEILVQTVSEVEGAVRTANGVVRITEKEISKLLLPVELWKEDI